MYKNIFRLDLKSVAKVKFSKRFEGLKELDYIQSKLLTKKL